MKKKKTFKPGCVRAVEFDLLHNGLYRQKVIPNKKKKIKKFDFKKEVSSYLNYLIFKMA